MHSKPYPFEFMIVKVMDYDCMHSGKHIKEIDKIPAVLCIPLRIDTIRIFWRFIILHFDEKQYTYTSEKYMHKKVEVICELNLIILISFNVTSTVFAR